MSRPLTVHPDHFHTVTGTRQQVDRHFREWGVALWLRANGSATLFFKDNNGTKRQKTWKTTKLVHGGK